MVAKMQPTMKPAGYSEAQRLNVASTGRPTDFVISCQNDGTASVTTPQGRPMGARTNAKAYKAKDCS